jgi:hypothetical protein
MPISPTRAAGISGIPKPYVEQAKSGEYFDTNTKFGQQIVQMQLHIVMTKSVIC